MPRSKRERPTVRKMTLGITDALDAEMAIFPGHWYGDIGKRAWLHKTVFEEAMLALCAHYRRTGHFPQPIRFEVADGARRAFACEQEMRRVEEILAGKFEAPPT